MKGVLLAFGFLTRLPVPTVVADETDMAAATRFFPLAGAAVGILSFVPFLIGHLAWGTPIASILAVAAMALVTGGLHLDGLADCLDGWLCNGNASRRLQAMHDPRIGALSAVFLSLFLLLKVAAVARCFENGSLVPALWAAPVLARTPLAWELSRGPCATPKQGMYAHLHAMVGRVEVAMSVGLGLGLLSPALLFFPDQNLLLLLGSLCALFFTLAWHQHWRRLIGGLSGDVVGAAVEVRELLLLLVLSLPGN